MRHEPTEAEWLAAMKEAGQVLPGVTKAALTAANTLRDRRIRNEALEEAARALHDDYWHAQKIIRALKDKEPNHE